MASSNRNPGRNRSRSRHLGAERVGVVARSALIVHRLLQTVRVVARAALIVRRAGIGVEAGPTRVVLVRREEGLGRRREGLLLLRLRLRSKPRRRLTSEFQGPSEWIPSYFLIFAQSTICSALYCFHCAVMMGVRVEVECQCRITRNTETSTTPIYYCGISNKSSPTCGRDNCPGDHKQSAGYSNGAVVYLVDGNVRCRLRRVESWTTEVLEERVDQVGD